MKRIICLILSMVMIFSLTGCSSEEEQDALIDYVNNDIVTLTELEDKFLDSYNSVSGDNYTSDEEMYIEFTNNTMYYATDLNNKAVEISQKIDDEEILEIHKIYMNYTGKIVEAMALVISSLENQDYNTAASALEKINEGNSLAVDFKNEVNKLIEERNLEFK